MKIPRVLVVEDEKAIAELISVNLRHHGMLAVLAEDGEAAQAAIDDVLPDVILLDWMFGSSYQTNTYLDAYRAW